MKRHPEPHHIVATAYQAASAKGVSVNDVLGVRGTNAVRAARRNAYLKLIDMGFSIKGIATVWGCDRKSLQRVRKHAERMAETQEVDA